MVANVFTPPVWSSSAYIRPIQTVIGGVRAWTHLAELRPPNEPPCRAYVKHFPIGNHRGLLNELIGHTVMHAMGVPQPRAALVQAPVLALPGNPVAWAFASCQPTPRFEGTPVQIYNLADPKKYTELVERLFSCPALPLLIAVDQLVQNADRNLGNLVFTSKSGFVAIDHSDILGGPAWTTDQHWFQQTWAKSRLIEDVVQIHSLKPQLKGAILVSSEQVSQKFFAFQLQLRDALEEGKNSDVQAAMHAVWWRCLDLTSWFKDRLQLLT
jgi:hypothetical protein